MPQFPGGDGADMTDTRTVSARARRAASLAACLLGTTLLVAGCGDLSTSPAAGTFTPRTRGVLTVVTTDIPSPGFWEGTPTHVTGGFEYELAKVLAERFGLKSVQVKLEHFHRIVEGQLDGADLALDLITPTNQRAQFLTFSSPYLNAAPTVVVRTGTGVGDLETARSLRWGAVRSTTFIAMIDSLITPEQAVGVYDNTADMLAALQSGKVDAVLLDMPLAVVTAKRSGGRLQAAAQLPNPEMIAARTRPTPKSRSRCSRRSEDPPAPVGAAAGLDQGEIAERRGVGIPRPVHRRDRRPPRCSSARGCRGSSACCWAVS
jgi:polar amino acid transport system substrate-binding protein